MPFLREGIAMRKHHEVRLGIPRFGKLGCG